MVAMVLTPPSGWDPRHFGKWSLKLPHESSSQPAKSRFKKKWMPNAPVELLCCKYFCPWTHWNLPFRGRSSIGKTHPQDMTWPDLLGERRAYDAWRKHLGKLHQKTAPHLRKVLLSSAPASLAPPSFQPFGKVDLQRLGIPKNHGLNHLGLLSQGAFNLPYIFQLILYCTTVTSEKIVSPGDHPSIPKDRSKSRTGAIKPGAIRCVSQHSPESNRFFHFGNGFKWPNVIPKPIITWISHPILIQKVAPKKIHPKMASFCTRQDLPKKRVDLLQLILHSTVVATIMVAAPSGHCALTGGGSSPAREGMNPPIFSSHLYRPLGCFRK